MQRVEKIVRILAYFAIAAVCLIRARQYLTENANARPSVETEAAKLVGTNIGAGAATGAAPAAHLIVAMNTSCIYCRASAPFYRKLLGSLPGIHGKVDAVAVMPEPEGVAVSYLQDSLALRFDSVVHTLPGLRVSVTPTLLIADRKGVVRKAWIGVLNPEGENQVAATLRAVAEGAEP